MHLSIFLTTGGPVNFPGLGLTIEYLVEGFEIFGIHISLVGILIAVAMFLGLFITERRAKKTEHPAGICRCHWSQNRICAQSLAVFYH